MCESYHVAHMFDRWLMSHSCSSLAYSCIRCHACLTFAEPADMLLLLLTFPAFLNSAVMTPLHSLALLCTAGVDKMFPFSRVHDATATQDAVFEQMSDLPDAAVDGKMVRPLCCSAVNRHAMHGTALCDVCGISWFDSYGATTIATKLCLL